MWNIYKKELIVDILTQLYPVCITSVVIKTDFRKLKKKKNFLWALSHCIYLISGFVKIDEMFQKLK